MSTLHYTSTNHSIRNQALIYADARTFAYDRNSYWLKYGTDRVAHLQISGYLLTYGLRLLCILLNLSCISPTRNHARCTFIRCRCRQIYVVHCACPFFKRTCYLINSAYNRFFEAYRTIKRNTDSKPYRYLEKRDRQCKCTYLPNSISKTYYQKTSNIELTMYLQSPKPHITIRNFMKICAWP